MAGGTHAGKNTLTRAGSAPDPWDQQPLLSLSQDFELDFFPSYYSQSRFPCTTQEAG